jgi:hypothetical protein
MLSLLSCFLFHGFSRQSLEISSPVAVVHTTGINQNLEWQGTDPLSLFQLERKLGEGYAVPDAE